VNIFKFLIKDIFRKKLRVLLTILGIGMGVCVCIVMLGVGESIKNSFKDVYGKRQIDIIIQEKDQLSILLSRVDANLGEKVQSIPAVSDSAATLLYLHRLKGSAVPVFGWQENSFLFDGVEMVKGSRPVAGKNQAMAGEAFMRSLAKEKDQKIKIKNTKFDLVGVFKSTSPFEQFSIVMPLNDLQAAIGEHGRASFINIKLKPEQRSAADIASVINEIEQRLPNIAAMRVDAFVAEKTKFIVMGEQFSLLVSLITMIAVALGLANTMVASSFEKRKFFAILLALGWQKFEIALIFICESLIVASLGGGIGIFLGFKGTKYIFGMTGIAGFAPVLSLSLICKIVGALLLGAILAALVPMWIALNADPVETIRNE
jgi:putative ABC transport system permease protein